MPKIIENLKDRLMSEVDRQLRESGYESVTIRSIAKACGVGVGTVYNYFPSKESLIAAHLLEDWRLCLESIQATAEHSDDPQPVMRCIYDQLVGFAGRHEAVFRAEAAVPGFAASLGRYHSMLRSQLSEPLRRLCSSDFAAELVAENLLTWSMAGKTFDEIYETMKKPF